jgi:hypothetical protein
MLFRSAAFQDCVFSPAGPAPAGHAINPRPAPSLLFLRTHPGVIMHAGPLPVFRTLHQTPTHGVQFALDLSKSTIAKIYWSYRNGRRSGDMSPVYLPSGSWARPNVPSGNMPQTLGSRSALRARTRRLPSPLATKFDLLSPRRRAPSKGGTSVGHPLESRYKRKSRCAPEGA